MAKTFTLYLSTSPYSYENTLSTIKIAESALNKGHIVNLIASADGVYCFLKKQKAKGTELRHIGKNYYLYKISHKWDKEKKQSKKITGEYLGRITEEGIYRR